MDLMLPIAHRTTASLALLTALLILPKSGVAQGQTWQGGGQVNQNSLLPPSAPSSSHKRDEVEIGTLYAVSVGYGVGMGIWFSNEVGIDDPGLFLIPPALLGVAAPVGVYFLDEPAMPRGMPASIAAGLAIGAGEGIGIASYQYVTANEADAWGFKGLSRATALGATLGGIGGYALGYYEEPSPKSTMLVSSSVLWGTAVGAMFGYGASAAGIGYGLANDSAGLGGLIGFNVGLVASAAVSMVYIPSWEQLAWMWGGAGVGAAVSLPVFLFYTGDNSPPAKRAFIFMGTAVTLGIAAGAVFGSGGGEDLARVDAEPNQQKWVGLSYIAPFAVDHGLGVALGGELF
jgi:hypothetical protein